LEHGVMPAVTVGFEYSNTRYLIDLNSNQIWDMEVLNTGTQSLLMTNCNIHVVVVFSVRH